jgi:hypothetical protein
MAEHYASGTWHVKQGKEEEFIERWTEVAFRSRPRSLGSGPAWLFRGSKTQG